MPWLAALSAILLAAGLWLGFSAPEDFQQSITVRIMYIHVPFAWLAMLCYSVMAVAATSRSTVLDSARWTSPSAKRTTPSSTLRSGSVLP